MKRFDVIVAGSGVIGASIAWHLTQKGLRVALSDPSLPASKPAASWASAGGLRTQGRHPAEQPISRLAAKAWPSLSEALDADLEISFGGHLHVCETEAEVPQIEKRLRDDLAGGVPITRVGPKEIREIAPALSPHVLLGAYTEGDGQAHPGRVTRAMVKAAERLGLETFFGRKNRLVVENNRLAGCDLSDGTELRAEMTVLAAGAWSIAVLADLGLSLPIRARGLQMSLSDVAEKACLAPTVTAVGRNLSLKQLRSGAYMLGGNWYARPKGHGLATDPIDAHASAQWAGAAAILPELARHKLVHQWAGTEAQALDKLPYIGASPLAGLYLACGFSAHGFQISPAIGALVAEALSGSGPVDLLTLFSPLRALDVPPETVAQFRAEPILATA